MLCNPPEDTEPESTRLAPEAMLLATEPVCGLDLAPGPTVCGPPVGKRGAWGRVLAEVRKAAAAARGWRPPRLLPSDAHAMNEDGALCLL